LLYEVVARAHVKPATRFSFAALPLDLPETIKELIVKVRKEPRRALAAQGRRGHGGLLTFPL